MLPEITVTDLSERLQSPDAFVLLDVREPDELDFARLNDPRVVVTPLSRLAREGKNALPEAARSQDATIYVLCHHGNRSAQVTGWLAKQGWRNVFNVRGGIDEYARRVDPAVGSY